MPFVQCEEEGYDEEARRFVRETEVAAFVDV
jgi:hypothetical protein